MLAFTALDGKIDQIFDSWVNQTIVVTDRGRHPPCWHPKYHTLRPWASQPLNSPLPLFTQDHHRDLSLREAF